MLLLMLCVSVLSVALPISAWATSVNMDAPMETTAPQTIDETTVSLCAVCQEDNCTREHVSCSVCEAYDCDIHAGGSDSATIQTGCTRCGLFGEHAPGCPNAPATVTETVTEVYHPKKTDGSNELDLTTIVGFPSTGILENGVTYKLTTNITTCFPLTVEAGSTVTIDLNGLMLEGEGEKPVITVAVDAEYTDGTVTHVNQYGTLYIKNSDTTPGNTITGYINSENVWSRANSDGASQHVIYQASITNRGTGMGLKVSGKLYITGNATNKILIIGCKSPVTDPGAAICGTSTAVIEMEHVEVCYNRTTREYTSAEDDDGNVTTMIGHGGVVHSEQQYTDVVAGLKATNCYFHHNSSKARGGAVSGGNITLIGCVMENNVAFRGGAVCANQSLNISGNSIIKNNQATDLGGGVSFEASGSTNVSISDTVISGNSVTGTSGQVVHGITVAGSGGGVQSTSEITLTNCVISNNTSNNNGGGVYATAAVTLSNCTLSGNSAVIYGGGLYTSGNMTFTNGSISENHAGRGGGIYTGKQALVNGNAVISGNESHGYTNGNGTKELGYGGGVYVASQSSVFTLADNASLENNTAAHNGGGIYCNGTFKLSGNAVIKGNTTSQSGAGAYVAWLEMSGGTVWDNHATMSGGGLAATFQFKITGGTIKNNTAGSSGGGVIRVNGNLANNANEQVNYISDCTIEGNVSAENGGGIFMGRYSLVVSGATIDNNEAKAGGGIFVQRGDITDYDAYVEITDGSVISNNKATNGLGGGIRVGVQPLRISNSTITANSTTQQGGGIYSMGTVEITDGTEISENSAQYGGGICCTSRLEMTDVLVDNNIADADGGGLYIEGSAAVTNAVISNNRAGVYGGGVSVAKTGSMTMTGTTVRNNDAIQRLTTPLTKENTGRGGGVSVMGTAIFNDVTIIGNRALRYGGGLHICENGEATWNSGTIEGNTSLLDGAGGVHVEKATLTIMDATVTGNVADEVGGGIHINNATLTIHKATVTNNTVNAGGGGGIHANVGATLNIHDGIVISGNRACSNNRVSAVTMASNAPGAAATLTRNGAAGTGNGGGLCAAGATVTMYGGIITDNQASGNGGGIAVRDLVYNSTPYGSTMFVISGSVTDNTAEGMGGGIYASGEMATVCIGVENCAGTGENHTGAYTDKTHPIITGNTADSGGGLGMENGATVTVYCADITDNAAKNAGRGNNVYTDGMRLTLHKATVGTGAQPGLVAVNGTVQREDTAADVILKCYRTNAADSPDKTAQISENEVFHLPDAQKYWSVDGYVFIGWTFRGPDSPPEYVRTAGDYQSIGSPVQAVDGSDGNTGDNTVHMYALWAPQTSTITYYGSIVDNVFRAEALATNGSNPTSYTFTAGSNAVTLNAPEKAGYTFVGWYVYQNEGQNANWGYEADNMYYFSKDTALELGNSHFGDITLIPCFTENTVTYTYYTVGPQGVANFGTLLAQDSNVGSGYTYTVKVVSGTPNAVTAEPAHRYKFVGWYTDAACTQQVTAATALEVQKTDGLYTGGTFYAKFDYYLDDLTITCDTTGFFRDQQHFVYEVWHGSKCVTTVVLKNGESVVIRDLVIGEEYTVKCIETWSWRFISGISEATQTVTLTQGGKTVPFRNTQQRHIWLTHDTYGWFGKTGNG